MRGSVFRGLLVVTLLLTAAVWLGSRDSGWESGGEGQVLYPPRPVPMLNRELQGRWTLLQFADEGCDRRCRHLADGLGRIQLALGPVGERLQRLLVLPAGTGLPQRGDGELQIWVMIEWAHLLLAYTCGGDGPHRICLVDPTGHLVLRYGLDASPQAIHDDLARLVRLEPG